MATRKLDEARLPLPVPLPVPVPVPVPLRLPLSRYTFWQDEADHLRGYALDSSSSDLLFVNLGVGGHVALHGARFDQVGASRPAAAVYLAYISPTSPLYLLCISTRWAAATSCCPLRARWCCA